MKRSEIEIIASTASERGRLPDVRRGGGDASPYNSRQKKIGILLMGGGMLFLLIIGLYFHADAQKIRGIPQLIEAEKVAAYIEFPTKSDALAAKLLSEATGTEWAEKITSWAGERAALVLMQEASQKNSPALIIEIRDKRGAEEFAKTNTAALRKNTLFNNYLIVTSSDETLNALLSASLKKRLGESGPFIKIRRAIPHPYFIYATSGVFESSLKKIISSHFETPSIPLLLFPFPELGMGFSIENNSISGHFYGQASESISFERDYPYRAKLLTLAPRDSQSILAGQNLRQQLKKISAAGAAQSDTPRTETLLSFLTAKYLPGIDFEEDVAPLLEGEFLFAGRGEKMLFALEIDPARTESSVEKVRAAFIKGSAQLAPSMREVSIADGTKAQEFYPDEKNIQTSWEDFEGIEIHTIVLGERGSLYNALSSDTLLISNDLAMLKKALLEKKEPAQQLQEIEMYAKVLQPILRNPELIGTSRVELTKTFKGTLGFSKRTWSDRMETDFMFVLE